MYGSKAYLQRHKRQIMWDKTTDWLLSKGEIALLIGGSIGFLAVGWMVVFIVMAISI